MPTQAETLARSFESFNPYANRALEMGEDADVLAYLAIAFEIGQIRYQLMKRYNDGRNTNGQR
jgi:hypothetical protein